MEIESPLLKLSCIVALMPKEPMYSEFVIHILLLPLLGLAVVRKSQ